MFLSRSHLWQNLQMALHPSMIFPTTSGLHVTFSHFWKVSLQDVLARWTMIAQYILDIPKSFDILDVNSSKELTVIATVNGKNLTAEWLLVDEIRERFSLPAAHFQRAIYWPPGGWGDLPLKPLFVVRFSLGRFLFPEGIQGVPTKASISKSEKTA